MAATSVMQFQPLAKLAINGPRGLKLVIEASSPVVGLCLIALTALGAAGLCYMHKRNKLNQQENREIREHELHQQNSTD